MRDDSDYCPVCAQAVTSHEWDGYAFILCEDDELDGYLEE